MPRHAIHDLADMWVAVAVRIAKIGACDQLVGICDRIVVAVSPEMRPVSEQSIVMLQKAVWEKGVDGLAPVQPAPIKVMHIDEINSTNKGKS